VLRRLFTKGCGGDKGCGGEKRGSVGRRGGRVTGRDPNERVKYRGPEFIG